MQRRQPVQRRRHAGANGRALSLYLTNEAGDMVGAAQDTAQQLELEATRALTSKERQRLIVLLQKFSRN